MHCKKRLWPTGAYCHFWHKFFGMAWLGMGSRGMARLSMGTRGMARLSMGSRGMDFWHMEVEKFC